VRSGPLEAFEKAEEAARADDLLIDLNQRDAPSDIIGNLEFGRINLGSIQPAENIGPFHVFTMASDKYAGFSNRQPAGRWRRSSTIDQLTSIEYGAYSRDKLLIMGWPTLLAREIRHGLPGVTEPGRDHAGDDDPPRSGSDAPTATRRAARRHGTLIVRRGGLIASVRKALVRLPLIFRLQISPFVRMQRSPGLAGRCLAAS
jgi:hypothetical protein